MIKRKPQKETGRLVLFLSVVAALLVAVAVGFALAFRTLRAVWHEQFRVEDRDLNVVISSGKMVAPEIITLKFGLTNGANLATIPYARLRETTLAEIPNIKDIKIERRLPDRVTLDVIEREPAVRVAARKGRATTGTVADFDGMTFTWLRDTATLPVIREETPTKPGKRLTGKSAAALRLVEELAAPELAGLSVLEIDTAHDSYLLATLGDYSRAKIAWPGMDDDTRASRDALKTRLKQLADAIASRLSAQGTTLWIATQPDRIYSSDSSRGR